MTNIYILGGLVLLFTATQVSPSELQDVFNETSSNIFQINANGKSPVSVCEQIVC